jgi:hypothetical protein
VFDFGKKDSQKRADEPPVHINGPYEYAEKKGIAFLGLMADKLLHPIQGFSCVTPSQDKTGFHYFHLTKLTKSTASQ